MIQIYLNSTKNYVQKLMLFAALLFSFIGNTNAQVTISGGTAATGSFTTLAAAITALNGGGALTAPVTVDVIAGHTEALTGKITMTATGDASNTITIQKSGTGANPKLTSFTGIALATAAETDGMFALVGSDYITIDGIDLQEAAANTTATTTMEYGYGLFKASATDGANNNLIKNCVITLNRVNSTAPTSGPAFQGSNGIAIWACSPTAMQITTAVTALSGASSNNKFYTNIIQNVNCGISMVGFAGATPFTLCDTGNDVGGSSAATGNTIINFGGGASATNACAAVFAKDQWSFNISYNTVDNNVAGTGGVNHPTTNRGVFASASSIGASATINNNNITIRGGTSTTAIDWAIDCEMAQSGAAGNTISINNNTISIEKTTATAVALTAIWANSAPSTLNINNNTITKFVTSSTATADLGPIRVALIPATININNNNISGVVFNGASGTNFIISSTGAITTATNIDNNIINGVSLPTASNTKTLNVITRIAAANTANASVSGNSFANITRVGSGAVTFIAVGTGTPLNQTISNNTFNNLTINSTGSVTFIAHSYTVPAGGTQTISNNSIVTAFNKTGAGGTVVCMTSGSSSIASNGITHTNNNFSNITVTGATILNGITNTDGLSTISHNRTVTGNTFSNWTGGTSAITAISYAYWGGTASTLSNNSINNITGQAAITGITLGASGNTANPLTISNNVINNLTSTGTGGAVVGIVTSNTSPAINISGNTIHTLSSTGAGAVTAISNTGATLNNIFKNKIYNLSGSNASSTVNGIAVTAGATVNLYNNIIGDLRTPAANAATPLAGINISGGTTVNAYYNTVHLNASSTGALFGSSAITVSSTPNVTLRNNIFVNNSTVMGAGLAVAHRRSSATLTPYNNASNNNMFFGSTLYSDGTNSDATLGAYKTRMATRDGASFLENPTFANTTTGANANFLHLNPSIGTQAESGAIAIAGFDDDIDGDIRQGSAGYAGVGTAPDLGADEGTFTSADLTPATISNVAYAGNACGTTSRDVTATIIDLSGVPTTGALMPRIYFRKNAGAYSSTAGVLSSGTAKNGNWTFTIDYAALGGIALNNLVEFYIVAQDIAPTPNLVSSPLGVVATNVNTVATAPTTLLSYLQTSYLTGTFTVGTGGNFLTLTAAVAAYNGSCMGGPITFQLTDALYNESVSIAANTDASAVNTLTIYPVNAGTVISGLSTTGTIDLNGAKFVTIDGRPGGTGTFLSGSSLVVNNTTGTSSAIRFINDANNNTVKFADVQSNNSNTAAATAGVVLFSTTTGNNGNDNNTITNCDIHNITGGNPVVGINGNGTVSLTSQSNDNNTISNSNIYDYFNTTSGYTGILVNSGNGEWTINNNHFYQTAPRTVTGTGFNRDIFINTPSATTAGSGFVITNNYIGGDNSAGTGIYSLGGTTAHIYSSISIIVGVGTPTSVQNNTITNIAFTSASTSVIAMTSIVANGGNVNIGNVTGNLIGIANTDASVTPAITYTNTSTTTGGYIPIIAQVANNATLSTTNISNNTIAGIAIAANNANNTSAVEFNAIAYNNGDITISNNTIGSLTTPKSIYCSAAGTASNTNSSRFVGILISASGTSSKNVAVTGNTIANMFTNHASPGAPATTGTRGVVVIGTMVGNISTVISNNTVRDLTTFSQATTGGAFAALGGISVNAASMATCEISKNKIFNLNLISGATSTAVQVTGMFIGSSVTGAATISKNLMHSFSNSSTSPTSLITGMDIASGTWTISNNMMSLGTDATGTDVGSGIVRGITKNTAITNIWFNTIYIGGSNVSSSAANSFAFQRSAAATTDDIRNNIFANNRTNAGAGKNYQAYLASIATLNMNYNSYFGTGVFGYNGTADVATYQTAWVAGDINSWDSSPELISPASASVDLHISAANATIIESTGTPITAITDDFDGDVRAGLTPTDIGADAGNFISQVCLGAPNGGTATTSNTTPICISGTKNLSIAGFTNKPGISYQWKESAVAGGPYTNVPVSANSTKAAYTTGTLTANNYYVCELTCSNGGSTALSSEVLAEVSNPLVLTTTGATRCGTGAVSLTGTATANATLSWYDVATGGASIATGNTLNIASLSATRDYYVEAQEGGVTNTTGRVTATQLGTAATLTNYGLQFTITETIQLNSVDVFSGTGTAITVALYNAAGTTQLFTTGSVTTTAGIRNTIPLNWTLVPGTYRIAEIAMTGSFFREGGSGISYPIALTTSNQVGQITGYHTSLTAAQTTTSTTIFYYFYNMNITTNCRSARQAVTATITPAPAFAVTNSNTICNDGIYKLEVTSPLANYNDYTWSPATSLYTDAAATIPYSGTNASTVYFKSDQAGVQVITASALNSTSLCAEISNISVTVMPAPDAAAVSPSLCISGSTVINLLPVGAYGVASVEWYQSTNGISFTQIPGVTTQSYTTPVLTATTYYEIAIIDGAGNSCPGVPQVAVDVLNPQVTATTPASRCGTGTVDLSAVPSTNATLRWFAASTGGSPLATSNTFTTPIITATKDYYVEAIEGGTFVNTAKTDANTTATSGAGTTNYGLVFDALGTFTLKSVKIYPVSASGAAGTVTIDVINSAGTVIQTKTVNVTGSPAASLVSTVVDLDFIIPAGTNYKLRPGSFTGITGLLFEPAASAPGGNYGYPYIVPGVVSINTSTLTAAPTNTVRNDLYYYFYDLVVSTACASPRTLVTATVTAPPALSISANQLFCTGQTGTLAVTSTVADFDTYIWSPTAGLYLDAALTQPYAGTSASTLYLNSATSGTVQYVCNALKTSSGCVNEAKTYVTFGLSGTATVASQPNSCAGTGLIAVNVSGAGTVVNEDFSSGVLPQNMTSTGNDFALTGGRMQLTSSAVSKNGGVLISNPTGLANNDFQIDFDMITTAGSGSPADGFSYSYGPDVVALPIGGGATVVNTLVTDPSTCTPENGSGSALKLSFDAYANGANLAGVYLMYNSLYWNQSSANTPAEGLISYTNNTTWRGGATTHVTISINAAGQVTMALNGIVVVTNQQLPATYLSANKADWKHAFAARTGAEYQGHFIDNLVIKYNNTYEYSINGSTWTPTSPIAAAPGTYNVTARYINATTCTAPLGSVTIDPVAITASTSKSALCAGQTTVLSISPATFSTGTYAWESAPTGTTSFTAISGATTATYTATVSASSDYRCVVNCGGGSTYTSSVVSVVASDPQILTRTNGANCGAGAMTLDATSSGTSIIKWYADATGGSSIATGTSFTTPSLGATTTYYVAASDGGTSTNVGLPAMVGTTANTGVGIGIRFDAMAPLIVEEIDVYPSGTGAGTATFELRTSTGAVLASYTANLIGTATPFTKVTLPVNFIVPAGLDYRIVWSAKTGLVAGMGRESAAANFSFPYTIPGVISLTASTTTGFYYYIYNWKIATGCESPRLPVVATIETPTVGGVTSADVTVCSGTNAGSIFLAGKTGNVVRWESAADAAFTAPVTIANVTSTLAFTNLTATTYYRAVVKNGACNEVNSTATKVTVDPCSALLKAKVYLNHVNPATGLMDSYYPITPGAGFPLSDPYAMPAFSATYSHVPAGQAVATTTATVLNATGADAIVDWVFVELRTGASGATTVAYTRAGLLQSDGDIVDTDGVSPLAFPQATSGNYYVAIRHRNHLGFRTDAPVLVSSANTYNFTNNSILLYGIAPLTTHINSATTNVMNAGDATKDGSLDSSDSAIWETENGSFDDYFLNTDYNIDGSIDGVDSALWEINNGKYEELQ